MNPEHQNIISPIPPVLDVLRRDIDWIDDQILDLLEQRYAVVKKVAWAKNRDAEQALAVRPAREASIIERLTARAIHVPEGDVAQIWRSILSLSAHHQRAYRVLIVGPESARLALLTLAAARHVDGVPIEWSDDRASAIDAAKRGEAVLVLPADEWIGMEDSGLDLIAQHATSSPEHPWALEVGRLSNDEQRRTDWSRTSWKNKVHQQLPAYAEPKAVRAAERDLDVSTGIVPLGEVNGLQELVAEAQAGKRVMIQAGDCAEAMDASKDEVLAMAALIDGLGNLLAAKVDRPAIRLGRLGGQYAKPRSKAIDGEGVAAYRGDAVNGRGCSVQERRADPGRMLLARDQAERVREWLTEAGRPIHLSHEALLLPYEAALTRMVRGRAWATSAHSLWLGERTRDPEGAHVEYLRGIANPIGIKCGPGITAEQIKTLLERLDPHRSPGRIMLVSRIGCGLVEQRLPALMAAVRQSGHEVLWLCDPMHGNNRSANGTKVRLVPEIIAEVEAFVRIALSERVHPGGLHLEVTPRSVLECVERLDEAAGDRPYESLCDPRLNAAQAGRVVAAYAAALEVRR